MNCFTRLAPLVDGAQGVIYDTALRGIHHQTLLRDLGLLPVNRVAAAKANPKHPRRAERRVENCQPHDRAGFESRNARPARRRVPSDPPH
jgi:hypothetical protein